MKPALITKNLSYWNRKLHIHLGLVLLLFIWLFSLSGLILNHGGWEFTSFWEQRKETKTVTAVAGLATLDSAATIGAVMQQLHLTGEVSQVTFAADSVDFRVAAPGRVSDLHVDKKRGVCFQKQLLYNGWGKLRGLHTFNGANKEHPALQPTWMVTQIWRLSMDGIALGLVFLCLSSWVMWYKLGKQRAWGAGVLAMGLAGAIYLVLLLKMF